MKLTQESKVFLGIIVLTITIIGGAAFLFSRPEKTYTCSELIAGTSHIAGNPDAKACLVEFSDYQCPACASFAPVVSDIIRTYGDRLAVVYRHFPLDQHEYAISSALAAEAAGAQGKFWEMSETLFAQQTNLTADTGSSLARELGLDMQRFQASLEDPTLKASIEQDKADALRLGIRETPTFFLNGTKLTLYSKDDLLRAVEEALR